MAFTVDPSTGRTTDPKGQSLDTNQHAGGGPALTASGLDLATGGVTRSTVAEDLASGLDPKGGNDAAFAVIAKTFDKAIKWRLQNEPMYRQFANVNVIDQAAFPGSAVTLFRTGARGLPLAVDPLSEYADPDAVSLPGLEDKMLVTVNEYGASTVVTSRLKRYAWTEIDPMQIEYVARAMRETVDAIYANAIYSDKGGWLGHGARQAVVTKGATATDPSKIALTAGTVMVDKKFPTSAGLSHGLVTSANDGSAASTAPTGYIDSAVIRRIVAHFRSLGVAPKADGNYVGLITPDQAVHLREETNVAGWRYPHLDGSWNGNILNGTVGIYENVRFLESPMFYGMDKGVKYTATDTFGNKRPTKGANCIFMGAEGIADVVVEEPHTVVTPTTDKFGRLFGLGFIGTFGAQVYDPNAILLVNALSD